MRAKHIPVTWHARLSVALVFLFSLALSSSAHAQIRSLIFERAQIRIDAPATASSDAGARPPRAPIKLDTELRGEDALALEYIHTLNTLDDSHAVLIMFDSPSISALPPMKVYTAVDVLFVADDGAVLQIAPSVVLGEMAQTIQAKAPVKAFLFMKAGNAAAYGIQPRDRVVGHMFLPPAPVQE